RPLAKGIEHLPYSHEVADSIPAEASRISVDKQNHSD
ncbi:hypothetical protein EVAR_74002_1, partial [Eumeta japonica]